MKKVSVLMLSTFLGIINVHAQNTFPANGSAGIGTAAPNASSLLEIRSTTKGMLVPRMTLAQRNLIPTPATGLLIFQTNSTPGFYFFNGTAWVAVSPKSTNTKLSNLVAPVAINQSLLPGTNNTLDLGSSGLAWRNGFFAGNVGIGNAAPAAKLDVAGSGWFRNDQNSLPPAAGTGVRVFFDQPSNIGSIFAFNYANTAPKNLALQAPGGNVGIGTLAPVNRLEVGDYFNDNDTYLGIKTSGGNVHKAGIKLRHFSDDYGFDIISDETLNGLGGFLINHHLANTAGVNVFCIDAADNVGIGTTTPSAGYKLTVVGKIICTELKVQLQPFPDYVFDRSYKLRSINEVEDHIKTYKRLPGMPAATEVEKNGMSVGEMQGKLVEKVEELTLYIIQQQKQMEALQKQINELKK